MGILNREDVEKVNRKFRLELNPGEDGEVRIPTAAHVDQCLKDGKDFNFAMRSYQDTVAMEEKEEAENKLKERASSALSKKKLGQFAGALFKLKKAMRQNGDPILLELLDTDPLVKDLPAVENSDTELDKEVKELLFLEAKEKLKKLSKEQRDNQPEAGGISKTTSSVQTAAAHMIANLKKGKTKLGKKLSERKKAQAESEKG